MQCSAVPWAGRYVGVARYDRSVAVLGSQEEEVEEDKEEEEVKKESEKEEKTRRKLVMTIFYLWRQITLQAPSKRRKQLLRHLEDLVSEAK